MKAEEEYHVKKCQSYSDISNYEGQGLTFTNKIKYNIRTETYIHKTGS